MGGEPAGEAPRDDLSLAISIRETSQRGNRRSSKTGVEV